jgi:hypothetical protein
MTKIISTIVRSFSNLSFENMLVRLDPANEDDFTADVYLYAIFNK